MLASDSSFPLTNKADIVQTASSYHPALWRYMTSSVKSTPPLCRIGQTAFGNCPCGRLQYFPFLKFYFLLSFLSGFALWSWRYSKRNLRLHEYVAIRSSFWTNMSDLLSALSMLNYTLESRLWLYLTHFIA